MIPFKKYIKPLENIEIIAKRFSIQGIEKFAGKIRRQKLAKTKRQCFC